MSTINIAPRGGDYGFYRLPQISVDASAEILRGLRLPQKTLDPKFFYDTRGSQLYEKITQTADYYLTPVENEILRRYAPAIAAILGRGAAIVEPGAGNCRKVEYLLEALRPAVYVPIDVSATALESACARLSATYAWLECIGIVAEFRQLERIAPLVPEQRRIVFFPGSTLGNMERPVALRFLQRLSNLVGFEGGVLIGIDNVKDEAVLNRAYDDGAGITAAFNKNVLARLNRIVGADFVLDNFEHQAFFNRECSRIEMHLVSKIDQRVQVAGEMIDFAEGETIHTENSYKYTRATFRTLAAEAGLHCVQSWQDEREYFSLFYLVRDNW